MKAILALLAAAALVRTAPVPAETDASSASAAPKGCTGCGLEAVYINSSDVIQPEPYWLTLDPYYGSSTSGVCYPKQGGGCTDTQCTIASGGGLPTTLTYIVASNCPFGTVYIEVPHGSIAVQPGSSNNFYPPPGAIECGLWKRLQLYRDAACTELAYSVGFNCKDMCTG
jgi:hypothetical protein